MKTHSTDDYHWGTLDGLRMQQIEPPVSTQRTHRMMAFWWCDMVEISTNGEEQFIDKLVDN